MTEAPPPALAEASPIERVIRAPIAQKSSAEAIALAAESVPDIIPDEKMASDVVELIRRITGVLKALEIERKSVTVPINDGLNRLNARFKALSGPLEAAKKSLVNKGHNYRMEQQRRADAEAEQIRKDAEDRALDEAQRLQEADEVEQAEEVLEAAADGIAAPIVAPVQKIVGTYGGVAFSKKSWTFAVEDITVVPAEFLLINQVAVNTLIRKAQDPSRLRVPGLKIYQKETTGYR